MHRTPDRIKCARTPNRIKRARKHAANLSPREAARLSRRIARMTKANDRSQEATA